MLAGRLHKHRIKSVPKRAITTPVVELPPLTKMIYIVSSDRTTAESESKAPPVLALRPEIRCGTARSTPSRRGAHPRGIRLPASTVPLGNSLCRPGILFS